MNKYDFDLNKNPKEIFGELCSEVEGDYNRNGHIGLTLFMFCTDTSGDKNLGLVEVPTFAVSKRYDMVHMIGREMSRKDNIKEISGVAMSAEVWFSRTSDKETIEKLKSGEKNGETIDLPPASKDPNKEKGIVISYLAFDGESYTRAYIEKEGKLTLHYNEGEEMTQQNAPLLKAFWSGYMNLKK